MSTAESPGVRLDRHADVAVLTIVNPPVNASCQAVRQGLLDALRGTAVESGLRGVVLIGAGETFVAGSDLKEFSGPVPEPLLPAVIAEVEAHPLPVVAALDGHALGGGLELALGCDLRVATERTRVGLPEVTLGMVPGAGGTQRLPRLVGRSAALDLITTGRRISAAEAARIGLVDELVEEPQRLLETAVDRARTAVKRRAIELSPPAEPEEELTAAADRAVRKGRGRPQVVEAVRLVRRSAEPAVAEVLADERATFDRLRLGPEAAALRHLFFAERAAGRLPAGSSRGSTPTRVGVVGAGTMGFGIAVAFAAAGADVTVVETNPTAARTVAGRIDAEVARQADRRVRQGAVPVLAGPVRVVADLTALADRELVVEAVFEDERVKTEALAGIVKAVGDDCVIATNTSYLDIEVLAAAVERPERFLGLHFFAPAQVMRLVEVVAAGDTGPAALATAVRAVRRLDKQPVLAGAGEGFLGNRIFAAYRRQVEYLLEEGALPAEVDAALEAFGFAMGPFAVADLSGLKIAWSLRQRQRERGTLPPRYVDIPDLLCEQGRFGRATGAGYYRYSADGVREVDPVVTALIEAESARKGITRRSISAEEIVDRAVTAMVVEASRVLADGVAHRPADVDVAMVHGYGFPRYAGGPLWWTARLSPERLVEVLRLVGEGSHDPAPTELVLAAMERTRTDG